jgi:hypothetical protein
VQALNLFEHFGQLLEKEFNGYEETTRKSCRGKFLLPYGEPGSKPDLPCKAK